MLVHFKEYVSVMDYVSFATHRKWPCVCNWGGPIYIGHKSIADIFLSCKDKNSSVLLQRDYISDISGDYDS